MTSLKKIYNNFVNVSCILGFWAEMLSCIYLFSAFQGQQNGPHPNAEMMMSSVNYVLQKHHVIFLY